MLVVDHNGRAVVDPQVAATRPMGLPLAHLTRPPTEAISTEAIARAGDRPPQLDVPARPTLPTAGRRRRRSMGLAGSVAAVVALGSLAVLAPSRVPGLNGLLGRGPAASAARPGDARIEITQLLSRMQTAVRAGDTAGIAALVDPADQALGARWAALPARVRTVGASAVQFSLLPGPLPAVRTDPAPARFDRYVDVPVQFGYTLAGWDRSPVATVLALRFGRVGSVWRLVGDSAAAPAARPITPSAATPMEPWVTTEVTVARTTHALVVGDPARRADNQRLAAELEQASRAVRAVLPSTRWNGQVVAYASTDPVIVASWFGGRAAREGRRAGNDPAAFAAEVRTLTGQGRSGTTSSAPVAARLAVTPYLLTRRDSRSQAVLRHEITHVALALEGQGAVPAWLVEGAAEFIAYRQLVAGRVSAVAALDRRGLPAPTWQQLQKRVWRPVLVTQSTTFYTGTNSQVARNYTDAWLTCLYIAQHYGEARLFQLYAAAATSPEQDPAVVEKAVLRSVLDVDQAELRRQVAAFARTLRTNFS